VFEERLVLLFRENPIYEIINSKVNTAVFAHYRIITVQRDKTTYYFCCNISFLQLEER